MKKERYFREELQRLFVSYAIIPAIIFTLVCGLSFMAVLIYGKKSGNTKSSHYVSETLERVLTEYENELEKLSKEQRLFTEEIDIKKRADLFKTFYEVSDRLGYEADLFILNKERELLLSGRQDLPDYLKIRNGVEWGIYAAMNSRPGEITVRLMEAWKEDSHEIAMGKAVVQDGTVVGFIIFTINSSQFHEAANQADIQTIITDRFGWVFLSSGYSFITNSNQVTEELKGTGAYINYENHMYLVNRKPVYHRMFLVYTISDIQNIVVSLWVSSTLIITALILMTVWVFISAKKVTEKKTEDFYHLLDGMKQAREGNLDDTIHTASENEFRIIADAYNEMIISLKKQMENNRRMTELVATAQNKQLESQFNPHFLYNTLENIRYMCKIEPPIAERMVFSLSSLLRYSLDGSQEEVTLEKDLRHLENYLTILKYRFNRRFTYQINVEPEAMQCKIPKLVLQPMIENSIKYGFGKQENLKVELKAYLHEEKLIMICRDDGVGMTPGVLSELTALLKQEENRSRHSGLYNIHRRIAILYGHPYGVEIRSAEGYGTTLIVTLPVYKGEINVKGINCRG